MTSVNDSYEYVYDQFLYNNDRNMAIVANVFTEDIAPTILGYPSRKDKLDIESVIANFDEEKMMLFYIHPVNHKLLEKDNICIYYKDIIDIKKTRINLGFRNKLTIKTKDKSIVLDYADSYAKFKFHRESRIALSDFLKELFA